MSCTIAPRDHLLPDFHWLALNEAGGSGGNSNAASKINGTPTTAAVSSLHLRTLHFRSPFSFCNGNVRTHNDDVEKQREHKSSENVAILAKGL